jgi:FG-GAP repeat protein
MSTLIARPLLAALSVMSASLSFGPAFAQEPSHHVHLQRVVPLPAEADTGPPNFEPLDNWFGADVAIRDGFAFAGMPKTNASGQVAVFTQQGTSGHWNRTATIIASDRTEGDDFGRAVSYRDGLLIVGSNRAAYVYQRVNGAWRERQKVVPGLEPVGLFAQDLKHEAGVLVIGATGAETFPVQPRGLLYIFERNAAGTFVRRARITGPEPAFGRAISMTKREIVVGSNFCAYIFGRNSSGNWAQRQRLLPAPNPDGDFGLGDFGASVAIDQGMILVGAPNTLGPDESSMGSVHGFVPGTGQYVETFEISAQGTGLISLGSAIAMFGNRIVVGASEFTPDAEVDAHAQVLTFSRSGLTVAPLGATGMDHGTFGVSVAIANNALLVGSPAGVKCFLFGVGCVGEANFFDLNRFEP